MHNNITISIIVDSKKLVLSISISLTPLDMIPVLKFLKAAVQGTAAKFNVLLLLQQTVASRVSS